MRHAVPHGELPFSVLNDFFGLFDGLNQWLLAIALQFDLMFLLMPNSEFRADEIAAEPASEVGFIADTTGSGASPELLDTQAENIAARTTKAIKLTNRNIPSPYLR